MNRILVTGAAGFVGAHLAARLAVAGHHVVGCDNYTDYYDPALKHARVEALLRPAGVACLWHDICDGTATQALLRAGRYDTVVHMAAQAGVRHSISQPQQYIQSNLVGYANVIDACVHAGVEHLMYASSSSVYGRREQMPFSESDHTEDPVSLYAATKKANELMAASYAHVHGLRSTGVRLFTVYGPWGRPDMAYFSFARRIREHKPIVLYAGGELLRDFTYIDDAVHALERLLNAPAPIGAPPNEIFNVGHHDPVRVTTFVTELERALGLRAMIENAPMQPGDVPVTCADPKRLHARIGPWTHTPLADGLAAFVRWLKAWEPDQARDDVARTTHYTSTRSIPPSFARPT